MGDVDESIDLIRYYSGLVEANEGYTRVMSKANSAEAVKSVLRPYGVWGVIAPFNFVALTVGMSTGALITGNTVVYKPATDTPWMGYRFYQYLAEAGLPKGVMNYVSGPGSVVGNALVEDKLVQGIVFTGSRDVGVSSHAAFTSRNPRPFIAEMGGKNAVIVTKNADLKKAGAGVATGAFGYSGQKCSATSRVYVDAKVKARFEKLLVNAAKNMRVDDPTRRDAFVTPLINANAYKKFIDFAKLGMKEGRVLFGGNAVKSGSYAKGYFVQPTIITDLPRDHPILTEELFVPILAVASIDSLDEAINEANKSEYGLTAGIFSEDPKEVTHFFKKIEAGTVYANRQASATTGAVTGVQPFVGWKSSGSSGKGAGGPYYLLQFLHEQTQTIVK
jgi:1-pyrroline-5-carboxylate dehydrogenase